MSAGALREMQFHLVASDIDGTLADGEGRLSTATVRTLRALLDAGVPVTLVTGLNPWPARRYVEQIGHGVRAISLNGVFLLEEGKVQPGRFIAPEVARRAVKKIRALGCVPQVYGEDLVTRYLPIPQGMPSMQTLIDERPFQPYEAVETAEALFPVPPAQVALYDNEARALKAYESLQAALGDEAYVVLQPGTRAWVEVNHPEARKDTVLLALAQRLDIAPEEVLYFGDSLNDRRVFERLPHCVAVANARPEIKALAWKIAPGNDEDGVARTLVKLFGLA
ncbi:MAG: HAD family hydrolase [Anaerolineae bacterium]